MKTMKIFLLLVFTFSNLTAQQELKEEQQLEEVKVTYQHNAKVTGNLEDGTLKVKKEYMEEFQRDPVKFCDESIDISRLIESMDSYDNDRFVVILRNSKGYIEATYNGKGELQKTFQKFENIPMPIEVCQELFNEYNGWSITKNKYTASGNGNRVNKEKWAIGIRKGNSTKNVKINPAKISKKIIAGR